MKKLAGCIIFSILLMKLPAQVRFATTGNSRNPSTTKLVYFQSNDGSALLHDFNVIDLTDCNGVVVGPGGRLYGTTVTGGVYQNGTFFAVDANGSNFRIIYNFRKLYTSVPPAVSPDGKIYIVISDTLYRVSADDSQLIYISKTAPSCKRIVVDKDQWIYGCGADNTSRFMFRMKTDGSGYSILHVFDPATEGILDYNNTEVCITPSGRLFITLSYSYMNQGSLVSMRTDGSDFQIHKTFAFAEQQTYGTSPNAAGPLLYHNGKIYFSMGSGGSNSTGTILSYDTLTSTLTKIISFPSFFGVRSSLTAQPRLIDGMLVGSITSGLYTVGLDGSGYKQLTSVPVSGYQILNFDTLTNKIVYSGFGGNFKNTQLVKVDPITSGIDAIHSFGSVPRGYNPEGLIRTQNGSVFGIARSGGTEGGGTIFKMNGDGSSFVIIKDFTGDNGQSPVGQLLYASDGRLYGVCNKSGKAGSSDSMLIYGIDVSGSNYSVLRVFETVLDGNIIPELSEDSGGELAGLICSQSSFPPPTKIFKIKKNGTGYKVIKTFSTTGGEGYFASHGLVFFNNYFYGISTRGGKDSKSDGAIFRCMPDGSNFSIVKYFYTGTADGSSPEGSLILGSDNMLYGATLKSAANNYGCTFMLNPSNLGFSVLYNFTFSDGFSSTGKFAEASDGRLYVPRDPGILGINKDGTNRTFINSSDYVIARDGRGPIYLTELPIPATKELCPSIDSTTITAEIIGNTYQWQVDKGSGFVNITNDSNYIGTSTASLQLKTIPSSWNGYKYRCLADGGSSKVYTLKFKNSWTGSINNSWENPGNWNCGNIPDVNTDVVITSGTVIVNSNVSVKSLQINTGVNFIVDTGFTVTINN